MMSSAEARDAGRARGGGSLTLLTLRLEGETFALPVERVQEIIDPLPRTPVPRAPAVVASLINVRGSVVPVVDLRRRLDMPPREDGADSRMVVLDVELEAGLTRVAMAADSVDQVIELAEAAVEPVPEIGLRWPARFLAGIAKRDGDLIILLRTETVFEVVSRASDARAAV